MAMDKAKLELEKMKAETNEDVQMERIKSENKREGARLAVDLAKENNKVAKEGVELAMDVAEKISDNA